MVITPGRSIAIVNILKAVMNVLYSNERTTAFDHHLMTVYVDARYFGLYLDQYEPVVCQGNTAYRCMRSRPHYGCLCLKIDAAELTLQELTGDLVEVLEVEDHVRLALNAMRGGIYEDEEVCDNP